MIEENELTLIKGGAAKWALVGAIGTAITFIVGLIDGYLRPLKCRY